MIFIAVRAVGMFSIVVGMSVWNRHSVCGAVMIIAGVTMVMLS